MNIVLMLSMHNFIYTSDLKCRMVATVAHVFRGGAVIGGGGWCVVNYTYFKGCLIYCHKLYIFEGTLYIIIWIVLLIKKRQKMLNCYTFMFYSWKWLVDEIEAEKSKYGA